MAKRESVNRLLFQRHRRRSLHRAAVAVVCAKPPSPSPAQRHRCRRLQSAAVVVTVCTAPPSRSSAQRHRCRCLQSAALVVAVCTAPPSRSSARLLWSLVSSFHTRRGRVDDYTHKCKLKVFNCSR
eukprot:6205804-Pleurochrysis_carterae.AAC.1